MRRERIRCRILVVQAGQRAALEVGERFAQYHRHDDQGDQ